MAPILIDYLLIRIRRMSSIYLVPQKYNRQNNRRVAPKILIFLNILEASMSAFYIKIMRFRRFPPCPFLEYQCFMNFAVHFIRARSSLILSYSSGSFLFILCYLLKWKEENCEWRGGRRWAKSVFNNWENF